MSSAHPARRRVTSRPSRLLGGGLVAALAPGAGTASGRAVPREVETGENGKLESAEHVAATPVQGFGCTPAPGGQPSDTEIAEIGTCIRNSRGNEHGLLTDEDVAETR